MSFVPAASLLSSLLPPPLSSASTYSCQFRVTASQLRRPGPQEGFGENPIVASHMGRASVAVGKTAILLHPPLPLVGVSIGMERRCQQNDSLADG